jgi:hypothetical protein
MMGGAAFTLLKAGCAAPKSAKQVEIRLAILPKILRNRRPEGLKIFLAGGGKDLRLWRFATISVRYA